MKISADTVTKNLPHRKPFLFVDKVLSLDPDNIEAEYTVKGDEYFFVGHFPDKPIMPGHIIAEALAQAALIMIRNERFENFKSPIFFLTKSHMRFLLPVRPGDKILLRAKAIKVISNAGIAYVEALVKNRITAKGEVSVAVRESE